MHVHLVFVPNTDARFLTMTRQKNYALTFQMYVLILKLNWLKWMANQITSLLINYPPKLAISSLVNSLKGISNRLLRRDRPDIAVRYYYKGVMWSPGYFASSCGGAPISAIRQYIEQQQTPG
ncbi:IS200/IS605 family transposase [Escherichia coli]|uniref:IS200/IS605 family transposase n=1 Tax=Escherichia coli TaxID=562 RepID=UPI001FCCBB60|nr:IS200/IS605 family transposase [Escherichia coli]